MDARWREAFRAWAATDDYRRRLAQANEAIARALARSQRPYVAYSGGKDSTAMLYLVLRQAPDVEVLHWDFGRAYVPAEVHQEVLDIARRLGAARVRVETSPLYARLGRQARGVMGRHLVGRLLPRMAQEGYDLAFVGLREEESLKRRRRMRRGRMLSAIAECWPLAAWTWRDVWACIVANGLPYLSLYDSRAALVGYDLARFTTLHDAEFAHLGSLTVDGVLHWRWRNWPE